MVRYAQLVCGFAGSGKSTYCGAMVQNAANSQRNVKVINLDPAAENFEYDVEIDIRDYLSLKDVMECEEESYGPNGGLVYCLEALADDLDWLREELGEQDEDYFLIDCPGQIELFTHIPAFNKIIKALTSWDFNICVVNLLDSTFMVNVDKFVSGAMTSLIIMLNLEMPHINLLSKLDLLSEDARENIEEYIDPDFDLLLENRPEDSFVSKQRKNITKKFGQLLDNFNHVKFMPCDVTDMSSLDDIFLTIDDMLGYIGECKDRYPEYEEENNYSYEC